MDIFQLFGVGFELILTDVQTGSSFSKQEHTVINIGDPDGVPRLVSSNLSPFMANTNISLRSPVCDRLKVMNGTQVR